MKRHKRKRGFTDKLYLFNLLTAWIYTIVCVLLTCFGSRIGIEDYSFVSVVTPLIWTELGIHSAFVIWKAKCENMEKFGKKDDITMI